MICLRIHMHVLLLLRLCLESAAPTLASAYTQMSCIAYVFAFIFPSLVNCELDMFNAHDIADSLTK